MCFKTLIIIISQLLLGNDSLFPEDVQHGRKPLLHEKSDELGINGMLPQRPQIAILDKLLGNKYMKNPFFNFQFNYIYM
jgi:hypothetical protein